MRKNVISILAIALIVVCIGCGSDKKPAQETKKPPTAASRETKTVEPIDDAAKAPETPTEPATPTITDEEPEIIGSADDIVAWRYKVETDSESKILVDKGKVFVVNSELNADYNKIICLDAKTGKKYWENNVKSRFFNHLKLLATDTCITTFELDNSEYYPYTIISFDIETGEKNVKFLTL